MINWHFLVCYFETRLSRTFIIILFYSIPLHFTSLLYACSNCQMKKSFQRATAIAMVFVSRKCDIALSVPRPTTFYWTRRYVDRKATSFDCLTAPGLLHASRCGNCAEHIALFAYRITCSISRHLLSAISSWSAMHSACIDPRECVPLVEGSVLHLHFFYAHLGLWYAE